MKFAFLGLCACMALTACVTDKKLDDYVCTHQTSLVIGANAAIANAASIKDDTLRQATIDGAKTTLALVARCAPAAPPAIPT